MALPPTETFTTVAAVYALLVNLLTFVAFWQDKRCARRGDRRISERSLLKLAAIGGAAGAVLGQRLLRHKTHKQPFRTRLMVIATIQAALAIAGCAVFASGFRA